MSSDKEPTGKFERVNISEMSVETRIRLCIAHAKNVAESAVSLFYLTRTIISDFRGKRQSENQEAASTAKETEENG